MSIPLLDHWQQLPPGPLTVILCPALLQLWTSIRLMPGIVWGPVQLQQAHTKPVRCLMHVASNSHAWWTPATAH